MGKSAVNMKIKQMCWLQLPGEPHRSNRFLQLTPDGARRDNVISIACKHRIPLESIYLYFPPSSQNSIRDRLRERALIEGVVWPPQLDFGCGEGATKTSRHTWAGRCD